MTQRAFKIYGRTGHRQRESFCNSYVFNTERKGIALTIAVLNSDFTDTNDFTGILIGTASDIDESLIIEELEAQLYDGIFENSTFGYICEIVNGEEIKISNEYGVLD